MKILNYSTLLLSSILIQFNQCIFSFEQIAESGLYQHKELIVKIYNEANRESTPLPEIEVPDDNEKQINLCATFKTSFILLVIGNSLASWYFVIEILLSLSHIKHIF